MACPVNHPLFHAVVFLIGVLVVLSRYVRAADVVVAPGMGMFIDMAEGKQVVGAGVGKILGAL